MDFLYDIIFLEGGVILETITKIIDSIVKFFSDYQSVANLASILGLGLSLILLFITRSFKKRVLKRDLFTEFKKSVGKSVRTLESQQTMMIENEFYDIAVLDTIQAEIESILTHKKYFAFWNRWHIRRVLKHRMKGVDPTKREKMIILLRKAISISKDKVMYIKEENKIYE